MTGKLRQNGSIESEGLASQNASDKARDAAIMVLGGACSSSTSSTARERYMLFLPYEVSTPSTSTDIRPMDTALLGSETGLFLFPSIMTRTWPSMVPPPTKSGAGVCTSNDTRG